MSAQPLPRTYVQVGRVLDKLGIPYLIGGSMATLAHGIPRLTRDVDIVALIEESDVEPLMLALKHEFYIDDQMINVLRKLEWHIAGGSRSEQQWRNVLGVLKTQGPALEFDYMRDWADTLGIRELLERALDESGSPDRLS